MEEEGLEAVEVDLDLVGAKLRMKLKQEELNQ